MPSKGFWKDTPAHVSLPFLSESDHLGKHGSSWLLWLLQAKGHGRGLRSWGRGGFLKLYKSWRHLSIELKSLCKSAWVLTRRIYDILLNWQKRNCRLFSLLNPPSFCTVRFTVLCIHVFLWSRQLMGIWKTAALRHLAMTSLARLSRLLPFHYSIQRLTIMFNSFGWAKKETSRRCRNVKPLWRNAVEHRVRRQSGSGWVWMGGCVGGWGTFTDLWELGPLNSPTRPGRVVISMTTRGT